MLYFYNIIKVTALKYSLHLNSIFVNIYNSYQINARTDLAQKYNDQSPLENHHKDQCIRIIYESNLFQNFSQPDIESMTKDISILILATDMSRHGEIMSEFRNVLPTFSFSDRSHLTILKTILIKACDISNECRPIEVSEVWVERLLQEYFQQVW